MTVTARPQLTARIAWGCSALVLIVFVVTALLMKHFNAGADFNDKDQVGTVVIGIVLALLLVMPTYPRLVADADSIRIRSFLGNYRVVPWDVVRDIRFPARVRFAQVGLAGDETLAIYAVQRFDKEYAVVRMAQLRELLEARRAADADQP